MGADDDVSDSVKRIVLGDWDDKGWYIKACAGTFELVSFPISEKVGA